MGRSDWYKHGDFNAICEVCGQKWKASKMRKRWDGAMVCPKDWEPRHPQDFVRAIPDKQSTPWSRPEAVDYFLPFCNGRSAIPGLAEPGCAIPGDATIYDTVPSGTFSLVFP
jgi:hypothetical protein